MKRSGMVRAGQKHDGAPWWGGRAWRAIAALLLLAAVGGACTPASEPAVGVEGSEVADATASTGPDEAEPSTGLDPEAEAEAAASGDLTERALVAERPASPLATATTARCNCELAALVAVGRTDGKVHRWTRYTPTSGSLSASAVVAGWGRSARLLASDASTGDLFVVSEYGSLYRYGWAGDRYAGATLLSRNFGRIRQLVAAGYGVLYGIDAGGYIYWWRWLGAEWARGSGRLIGRWRAVDKIFGGGDGILYGIKRRTGTLYWYRHVAAKNGHRSWRGPRAIGRGWGAMREAVGLGGGVIYAVDARGRLLSYQHLDLVEGGAVWANGGAAEEVATGWLGYTRLTAGPNACPTFPENCMSQGDRLLCGLGIPTSDDHVLYRDFQGTTSRVRYCAHGCQVAPERQGHRQDGCLAAPGRFHVAIQAGHENASASCRDALVGQPGAAGEAVWAADVARRVVAMLTAEGLDALAVDANFNCDPLATQHFDAVVAIHYQGTSSIPFHGGYFVETVRPEYDPVTGQSDALVTFLDLYMDQYGFPPNHLANLSNIYSYYLKNGDLLAHPELLGFVVSQDTPIAVIEAGEGAPATADAPAGAQHDLLWNNRDLVASAIAEGILQYANTRP